MPPRKKPAPAPHPDPEPSPDPLQMTGKSAEEQPTSGRRSMRSRNATTPVVGMGSGGVSVSGRKRGKGEVEKEKEEDVRVEGGRASKKVKVDTPKKKAVVPTEASAETTSRRAAELMVEVQMQLNAHSFSPGTGKEVEVAVAEEGGRASKRAKVDTPKKKAIVPKEALKAAETSKVDVTTDVVSPAPSPTKRRGRPPSARKTAATADVSKTATPPPRTSKRTATKTKPVAQEVPKVKDPPAEAKTPSKRKAKALAPPIRHSSNPLDDAPAPTPEPTPQQTKTKEPDVLKELEEPEPRASASFDLQSRDAFLRNERWQRDKEARNFNFEGDVNEGRRLRSGKAVVSVGRGTSEMGEEDDEKMVVEEDDADESGYEEDGKRAQGDSLGEDAVFEADNDYLSQLAYDANLPVEALKTTLADRTEADSSRVEEPKQHALTPFAQKVLRTVIGNLAGCETYSPSTMMGPEEEKDESLKHLVNLLTGTVERGEGNSCLVLGAKGSGKTRTVRRAISIVRSAAQSHSNGHSVPPQEDRRPIIVRLDGLAQTNDMLAIREMGRQIALGQGEKPVEDDDQDEDAVQAAETSAPTTLPAHLLAHLTAPSARAIVVVIENFDLFTNHARQALLYCLLDVVQGVRTGPVASTGRGVAVIGITSRMDTTLLLEKRVKSRFSQRIYRVVSPLSTNTPDAWRVVMRQALVPEAVVSQAELPAMDRMWLTQWESQVDAVLGDEDVEKAVRRICELSTDVRILLRPFIQPVQQYGLSGGQLRPEAIVASITEQIHCTGWGKKLEKLRGLSHPSLVILIIAKHFAYAGKEEFNLAMVEHEYQRFARTQLAGSGRARWSAGILETAWRHLMQVGLLFPATRYRPSRNPYMQRFILCRSLLSRTEIIAYFKGEGGKVLGTELTGWGRTAGGHA